MQVYEGFNEKRAKKSNAINYTEKILALQKGVKRVFYNQLIKTGISINSYSLLFIFFKK